MSQKQFLLACPSCGEELQSYQLHRHKTVYFMLLKNNFYQELKRAGGMNSMEGQKWWKEKNYWKRGWQTLGSSIKEKYGEILKPNLYAPKALLLEKEILIELGENQGAEFQLHEELEKPGFGDEDQKRKRNLICSLWDRCFQTRWNEKRHFAQIHFGIKNYGKEKKMITKRNVEHS